MKVYSKVIVLALISLFALTSCEIDESPTRYEEQYGDIEGRIHRFGDSQPLQNAIITLNPTEGSTISSMFGSFKLYEISEGTYTLNVNKKGYQEYKGSVVVRADKTTSLDIFLKEEVDKMKSDN